MGGTVPPLNLYLFYSREKLKSIWDMFQNKQHYCLAHIFSDICSGHGI